MGPSPALVTRLFARLPDVYGVAATLKAIRTYSKEHGRAIGADAYWPLLESHYASLLVRYIEGVFDAKALRVVLSEPSGLDVPLS